MTAATEPEYSLDTPFCQRDTNTTLSEYRDRQAIVSGALWEVLVHDPVHGPRMAAIVNMKTPDAIDDEGEDLWVAVWELVYAATSWASRLATSQLIEAFDPETATSADVARAAAAILGRRTVEDGQPYAGPVMTADCPEKVGKAA